MRLSGVSLRMYPYVDCKGGVLYALKYFSGVLVVFSSSIGWALSLVMLTVWISGMLYVMKLSWWQHSIRYYLPDSLSSSKWPKLIWTTWWGCRTEQVLFNLDMLLDSLAIGQLIAWQDVCMLLSTCLLSLCLLTVSLISQATTNAHDVWCISYL